MVRVLAWMMVAAVGMTAGSCVETFGSGNGLGAACPGAEAVRGPQIAHPADGCAGDWCVYADQAAPPMEACVSDAECNAADPAHLRFACEEGACVVSAAYVDSRSMCTRECASDGDCELGLADDTTCATGFACVYLTTAMHCCARLCACADDLSADKVDQENARCSGLPHDPEGDPICDDAPASP